MLVGMVVNKHEMIVPILDGTIARIYNTETGEIQEMENPALKLQKGRRYATLTWMIEKGVNVLCTPPSTLCEISYSKAQKEKIKFYRLQNGMKFSTFKNKLDKDEIKLDKILPFNEVSPKPEKTFQERTLL